jgi:hypothetical protein
VRKVEIPCKRLNNVPGRIGAGKLFSVIAINRNFILA